MENVKDMHIVYVNTFSRDDSEGFELKVVEVGAVAYFWFLLENDWWLILLVAIIMCVCFGIKW